MAQEITYVCDWCGTKQREDDYPEPADWATLELPTAKKSNREKGQRHGRVDVQIFPLTTPTGMPSILICPKCVESIQSTLKKLRETAHK